MLLKDRVAIITGAAAGIGEGTAKLFAAEGAIVYMADRDAGRLESAAAAIRTGNAAVHAIVCDVTDSASVAAMAERVIRETGRVEILINNAGVYPRRPFLEMTEDEWDRMQDINLKGTFRCTKAVLPNMVERRSGKIVNISSVTFHVGLPNLTHYIASKGGIIGLTRSLAREMGDHNIHVNCITPGAIEVEREKEFVTQQQVREMLALQCLQRRIVPLDIARVCAFLSCELSDGMTGQTLNVDGGWYMH